MRNRQSSLAQFALIVCGDVMLSIMRVLHMPSNCMPIGTTSLISLLRTRPKKFSTGSWFICRRLTDLKPNFFSFSHEIMYPWILCKMLFRHGTDFSGNKVSLFTNLILVNSALTSLKYSMWYVLSVNTVRVSLGHPFRKLHSCNQMLYRSI